MNKIKCKIIPSIPRDTYSELKGRSGLRRIAITVAGQRGDFTHLHPIRTICHIDLFLIFLSIEFNTYLYKNIDLVIEKDEKVDVEKLSKNHINFVIGGSRSGKSAFALKLAENLSEDRTIIATCPRSDDELNDRIERHKRERHDRNWHTVEETIHISQKLNTINESHTILIDCITLWINNLLYESEKSGTTIADEEIYRLTEELCWLSRNRTKDVVIVSNETGLGIIPDNALARRFRDISGKCNQIIAGMSDHVYFIASGIPIKIK